MSRSENIGESSDGVPSAESHAGIAFRAECLGILSEDAKAMLATARERKMLPAFDWSWCVEQGLIPKPKMGTGSDKRRDS